VPDELHYVNKGRGQPRLGIIEQGHFTGALAVQYQAELVDHGFDAAKIAQIGTETTTVEGAIEDQVTSRGTQESAGEDEVRARAEGKAFGKVLRDVAPIVVREHPTAGVSVDSFFPGEPIGTSTARLVGYLVRLRGPVSLMDEHLARYFKGQSPKAILETLYQSLKGSNVVQELSLTNLPDRTRKIYAAKGRLLELIEDCNRIGRVAFADQPEIRAKFNKDILLRARKARKVAPEPAPTPGV